MKKKRKQSFSKKSNQKHSKKPNQSTLDSKTNNLSTTNTEVPVATQSSLDKSNACALKITTSLCRLDDNSTNMTTQIRKPLVRKSASFLLRRESINLNDCLKPQWMQSTHSDFDYSLKSQSHSFQKLLSSNYMFNLSNLKSINMRSNNHTKTKKMFKKHKLNKSRIILERVCLIQNNCVMNLNVNINFKISFKFKYEQCKNWLLSSMGDELSHLKTNEFKMSILNFNHVNDLETEINELFIINLINLKHEKSLNWFTLLKNLKSIKLETKINDKISCDSNNNEILNMSNNNLNTNKSNCKKPRPSYLIERDCHIFGGCVDDDALDEFFISSGAVYQSWPYVYEPGFQLVPLFKFEDTSFLFSRSDNRINYLINDDLNQQNKLTCAASNSFDDELPSYSLDNFEINLVHVNSHQKSKKHKSNKNRKKSKASRKKRTNQPVYNENNELVYSSSLYSIDSSNYLNSSYSSDEVDDDDDDSCSLSSSLSTSSDDSESFKAYKKRHEIGLNYNNLNNYVRSSIDEYTRAKCCSHMSLNELRETNLTDSSSFENYLYNFNRAKKSSHMNNKSKMRMTNSCKNNDTNYNGLNFKVMKRFLSHRDFWQINEENNYFRHHSHQQNRHVEYSDQLVYC